MAFTNEEVMRATELALRQYHVVQKEGGGGEASQLFLPRDYYRIGNIIIEPIVGEVVAL